MRLIGSKGVTQIARVTFFFSNMVSGECSVVVEHASFV